MGRQLKDFVRAKKNSCDAGVVGTWRCFEKVDCLGCGDGTSPTPPILHYLSFSAEEPGSTITLNKYGNPTVVELEISMDGKTWNDYTFGEAITLANVGDRVYMRNKSEDNIGFSTSYDKYYGFAMTGKVAGCGDVTTLLCKEGTTSMGESKMNYLFRDCKSLTKAPELPATEISTSSYESMFSGCTSLVEAPDLPVTSLARSAFYHMFTGCTSLTKAPELPWTELDEYCYYHMFDGCTSLVEVPELPATKMTSNCYAGMFRNCTSLVEAPELPATTLATACYGQMFEGCTSLTKAPELPATELMNNCYINMFQNCTSLTTVPELSATTLANNCYYGMFRGCTSLTTPPELPATTLANSCYGYMFQRCAKIKLSATQTGDYQTPYRIPSEGTGTTATSAMTSMFTNTGGPFKGTPVINTTYYLA